MLFEGLPMSTFDEVNNSFKRIWVGMGGVGVNLAANLLSDLGS